MSQTKCNNKQRAIIQKLGKYIRASLLSGFEDLVLKIEFTNLFFHASISKTMHRCSNNIRFCLVNGLQALANISFGTCPVMRQNLTTC
jgi:hypothetical protein